MMTQPRLLLWHQYPAQGQSDIPSLPGLGLLSRYEARKPLSTLETRPDRRTNHTRGDHDNIIRCGSVEIHLEHIVSTSNNDTGRLPQIGSNRIVEEIRLHPQMVSVGVQLLEVLSCTSSGTIVFDQSEVNPKPSSSGLC